MNAYTPTSDLQNQNWQVRFPGAYEFVYEFEEQYSKSDLINFDFEEVNLGTSREQEECHLTSYNQNTLAT